MFGFWHYRQSYFFHFFNSSSSTVSYHHVDGHEAMFDSYFTYLWIMEGSEPRMFSSPKVMHFSKKSTSSRPHPLISVLKPPALPKIFLKIVMKGKGFYMWFISKSRRKNNKKESWKKSQYCTHEDFRPVKLLQVKTILSINEITR